MYLTLNISILTAVELFKKTDWLTKRKDNPTDRYPILLFDGRLFIVMRVDVVTLKVTDVDVY